VGRVDDSVGGRATGSVRSSPHPTDLAVFAAVFGRTLRACGLEAPPSSAVAFAEALSVVGVRYPNQVFAAGAACFCRGPEDVPVFARVFSAFFATAVTPVHPGRLTVSPPAPVVAGSRPTGSSFASEEGSEDASEDGQDDSGLDNGDGEQEISSGEQQREEELGSGEQEIGSGGPVVGVVEQSDAETDSDEDGEPADGPADGPDASDSGDGPEGSAVTVAYSAREILRRKDFASCSDAELAEIGRLMSTIRRRAPQRRGRRLVPTRRTGRGSPDLRRTVRTALAHDGEPVRLSRRVAGDRARPLVLLLDVSGSMRPYARALLLFAHSTVAAHRAVEAFTLGTRCTRVTRELRWRDPDAALARAAAAAPDIEGGTRLGEGLAYFNSTWGSAGLARGAIVAICSDGWDRGDPAQLALEMQRLSRTAHRIVWVNPLKASDGYEPLARGMAAALPYVGTFVSGHSLEAIEELAEVIAG